MSTEVERSAIGEWQESEKGTQGRCYHCGECITALCSEDRRLRYRLFRGRKMAPPVWINACLPCRLKGAG